MSCGMNSLKVDLAEKLALLAHNWSSNGTVTRLF